VPYVYNTLAIPGREEREMEMFRTMQPRDWMIAVAAFVAGAFIF
jgi:hypothetical protein